MWVLILFLFAEPYGASSHVKSSSTTNVPGFVSKSACERAGKKSKELEPSQYEIKYVCVNQE